VADGVGSICKGFDPGLAITISAQVCANALAAVYSRTVSGAATLPESKLSAIAQLLSSRSLAAMTPTKQGYYQACAGSCNNAQSAAEALSQGAACGAAKATHGCIGITAELRSDVFSRAFSQVTTEGWSKACAQGSSAALTGTTTMAASAAAAFASAIARVAAKACATCPTCKCSPLPFKGGLNTAGRWSEAFSTFAGGKVGLARVLAGASSAQCTAGEDTTMTKVTTDAAMAAVAEMIGGSIGRVKATAVQMGAATACSGASLAAQLQAVKQASNSVLSDAAATVYGDWCPKAAAKLANVKVLTSDAIAAAANKKVAACGSSKKGLIGSLTGLPQHVSQAKIITDLVFSNAPVRKKITEALNEAQKCGCPPSLCLFCKPAKVFTATPQVVPAAPAST